MISNFIFFLCTAALFLTLLTDRFRFWVTVGAAAAVFALAMILASIFRAPADATPVAQQVPIIAGTAVFFLASLVLFVDNPLQKLFVACLCVCSHAFADFFIPVLLGVLPFKVAGGMGGFVVVLSFCLWTLLLALCLYHPLHHFSDRGVSGFLVGMCLLLGVIYILSLGKADFLFRGNIAAEKVLVTVVLFGAMIFAFRSVYNAGRFRARTAEGLFRNRVYELEQDNLSDLAAALREVRTARKESEYTLDTVSAMLAAENYQGLNEYVASAKAAAGRAASAEIYHADPALNTVIAMKAAFARQHDIAFSCNPVVEGTPLNPQEICVITRELLARACADAAAYTGPRRVRFTAFPSADSILFEAVYTAPAPKKRGADIQNARLAQIMDRLFEDHNKADDLRGLDVTREIINLHSGRLSLSAADGETILQARIRF